MQNDTNNNNNSISNNFNNILLRWSQPDSEW